MRRLRGLAVMLAALAAAAGCGGDDNGGGGNGPDNEAPTAGFALPTCVVGAACAFTDASTDPDGVADITTRAWTFENGTPATSADANPTVTFSAAGPNTVTLTVTDAAGESNTLSQELTLGTTPPPPENQAPVAAFTVACTSLECTFDGSGSTDADGTIASYAWDFGEPASGANNTSTEASPTHTYAVTEVTDFTVTLTVTDDDGTVSTPVTQTISVSPPAELQCETGGGLTNCTLDLTSKATLVLTLTSNDCEFTGNQLRIIAPVQQTVFLNGCNEAEGTQYAITGPNPDGSFEAGTHIQAEFTQGAGDPDDPEKGPPAIRLDGTFPTWTINIDDGGAPTAPGEPDFNDIVVTAQATVVP
ncbi:MAG TPA: PKD domain-containing protein [Gemmatimonadales bacterium]|nr:PKD domain-containing protein [Gemmatimonadales bacterium]